MLSTTIDLADMDLVWTNIDLVSTDIDLALTDIDLVSTNIDLVSSYISLVSTHIDLVSTDIDTHLVLTDTHLASTGIDQYQPDIDGYCPTSTRYRLLLMAIHQISEVPPAKVIDLHWPISTWSMLVDVGRYSPRPTKYRFFFYLICSPCITCKITIYCE